jgi:tryptophan synthase alpha chain
MNRIQQVFKARKRGILSVYYTAGFPKLDDTELIGKALEESGADIIEIGIPFSDPIADGPVIQESNKVALDNGMNVKLLLKQVGELRKQVSLPIILMGYLNPVLQFGVKMFCDEAARSGVDGLILPDMPVAEYEKAYKSYFNDSEITITFLISPTTSVDRIRKIDSMTKGFIYAVSASSTTGTKRNFSEEQLTYFNNLKKMELRNPFLIGFGISNRETFSAACGYGAGAIVGSAFISMLNESAQLEKDIKKFVSMLKEG